MFIIDSVPCPLLSTGFVFINSYLTCFLPAFGKPESPSFSSLKASWLGSLSSFITKLIFPSKMKSVLIIPSSATLAEYLILFLQYPYLDQGFDSRVSCQGIGSCWFWLSLCWIRKQNVTSCNLGFILFSPNQTHILKKTLLFF